MKAFGELSLLLAAVAGVQNHYFPTVAVSAVVNKAGGCTAGLLTVGLLFVYSVG